MTCWIDLSALIFSVLALFIHYLVLINFIINLPYFDTPEFHMSWQYQYRNCKSELD